MDFLRGIYSSDWFIIASIILLCMYYAIVLIAIFKVLKLRKAYFNRNYYSDEEDPGDCPDNLDDEYYDDYYNEYEDGYEDDYELSEENDEDEEEQNTAVYELFIKKLTGKSK